MPTSYPMTIEDTPVYGTGTFEVGNPATGTIFAQAPEASQEDVNRALSAALRAWDGWQADRSARAAALQAIAQVLRANQDEIARTITCEMGKPLRHATGEVLGAAAYFDYYASLELPVTTIRHDDKVHVELRHKPVGPVAAITPWNGPIILMASKVAAALSAGNPVVLKPSPYSPVSSLLVGQLVRGLLPPGVFAVLTGSGDLGRWLSEHPLVRKVSFTGSVEVGKRVAAGAAADLKRVTLELGGNDPAIALDDVDAEDFASRITSAALSNAGQICIAPKRIYVPSSRYDEVVDAFVAAVRAVRVGNGLDPETVMGPVVNQTQLDFVSGLVVDAQRAGGKAIIGDAPADQGGTFYPPTLITGVGEGCRVVDEEQFGPVIPVIRYESVDDAVSQANGTMYGLGSSVWSADLDRAAAVADRLQAGHSWINTHFASVGPGQALAGVKWSGIGIEGGPWGLEQFADPHLRYVNLVTSASEAS